MIARRSRVARREGPNLEETRGMGAACLLKESKSTVGGPSYDNTNPEYAK